MAKENTNSSGNQDIKPRSEDTAAANEAGIYHEKDGSLYPGRPIKAGMRSGIQGAGLPAAEAAPIRPEAKETVQDNPDETLPVNSGSVSLQGQRRIMGEGGGELDTTISSEPAAEPAPESELEKGVAPLAPETKLALNEIIAMPVEQRREAMGKFLQSQRDGLGNTTQEGNFLQLDTEVLRDGKGIKIRDENGTVYQIDYE
jgi:hypothetical protein